MAQASSSQLPATLLARRVIPALRDLADLPLALDLGMPAAILLKGDIFDLDKLMSQTKGKMAVLLHIDLIEGIGCDGACLAGQAVEPGHEVLGPVLARVVDAIR